MPFLKKSLFSLFGIFLLWGLPPDANAQLNSFRGLYVNQFQAILGNAEEEQRLSDYLKDTGFTYVTLYNLHSGILGDPEREKQLSDFILKLKLLYGIKEVGAALGNHPFSKKVDNYNANADCSDSILSDMFPGLDDSTILELERLNCFNQMYPGKFDVINLEDEYWNAPKRDSAFNSYITTLRAIRYLAKASIPPLKVESYLGWPLKEEAEMINAELDRVLLHIYRKTPYDTYNYVKERLSFFSGADKKTVIAPIFSSEPDFMQDWLKAGNSIKGAEHIFLNNYAEGNESWKQNIKLEGFQWFTYTVMPRPSISLANQKILPEFLRIYPNPGSGNIRIHVANPSNKKAMLHVFDGYGRLLIAHEFSEKSLPDHPLEVTSLKPGVYSCVLLQNSVVVSTGRFQIIK